MQYARACGASVIAIDSGKEKGEYVRAIGAAHFIDFKETQDIIREVHALTSSARAPPL